MAFTARMIAVSGSLALLAAIATSTSASARPNLTVIHNFGGGSDGAGPQSNLVTDNSGALYGTTFRGGAGNKGTAFKLTRPQHGGAWAETVLHSFIGSSDGTYPSASLLLDSSGNLYGTTQNGGAVDAGVAFELTRAQNQQWAETVLHSFGVAKNDARFPQTALVMDKNGALYGTGLGGHIGFGAVFQLAHQASGWKETTLHSFDLSDGYIPHDLLIDRTGTLYGTTRLGGSMDKGVVFAVAPTMGGGWSESTIHFFLGGPSDGAQSESGLILGLDGALYGTTSSGGAFDEGIVFKLTPAGGGAWTETDLWNFDGHSGGGFPQAGVVIDRNGALYGTAIAGGDSLQGVVYKLTPQSNGSYVESVLHSFTGGIDGGSPNGGLVFESSGALYGTTSIGGLSNLGIVFKL